MICRSCKKQNPCRFKHDMHSADNMPKCLICRKGVLDFDPTDFLGESPLRFVPEVREGQLKLAQAIHMAMLRKNHVVSEAQTGVGKSFAALLPPILAGRRATIATPLKTLQSQYAGEDLPRLREELAPYGIRFKWAVRKGKSNYPCTLKLLELERSSGESLRVRRDAEDAIAFIKRVTDKDGGEDGDVDAFSCELTPDLRDRLDPLWRRINAGDCASTKKCPRAETCLYAHSKSVANDADIIIANHALLAFDLKYGGRLLPESSLIVIDEAHKFENAVREAFGAEFRQRSIERVCDQLSGNEVLGVSDNLVSRITELTDELFEVLVDKFGQIPQVGVLEVNSLSSYKIHDLTESLSQSLLKALDCFTRKDPNEGRVVSVPADHYEEAYLLGNRILNISEKLSNISANVKHNTRRAGGTSSADQDTLIKYYVEFSGTPGHYSLTSKPVQVAPLLKDTHLFSRSCVSMSATLAYKNSLLKHKQALGYPPHNTEELITPTPFDYLRQSFLYLSTAVPEPNSFRPGDLAGEDNYYRTMHAEIRRLLGASQGGAFVLFSSRKDMEALVDLSLQYDLGFPMRHQEEEMDTSALERWFRKTPNAVLFGLKSFWEGVSIPGKALRLVIITKLPFRYAKDAMLMAEKTLMLEEWERRRQHIQELVDMGEADESEVPKVKPNTFSSIDMPYMVTELKQGVGRLIRTKEDQGILAILDQRLITKRYAHDVLSELPFALADGAKRRQIHTNFKNVEKFFEARRRLGLL